MTIKPGQRWLAGSTILEIRDVGPRPDEFICYDYKTKTTGVRCFCSLCLTSHKTYLEGQDKPQ